MLYLFVSAFLSFAPPANDTIYLETWGVKSLEEENNIQTGKNSDILISALKFSSASKTVVKLPAGKIWINKSIILPDNINLVGDKGGSVLILSSNNPVIEEGIMINENYNLGNSKSNFNIKLSNFTINADRVDVKGKMIRGIFLNKVKNVNIEEITVIDTKNEGIRVDVTNIFSKSTNITIDRCEVYRRGFFDANIMLRSATNDGGNSKNIPTNFRKATISNNVSVGGQFGICLFNVDSVSVVGNTCIKNLHRGIIASPTCSSISIRKNIIDSAGSTGIHLAYNASKIVIDSNRISNTLKDMSGKGYEGQGIKAYVGFKNITITNNHCSRNATDGIALEGGAPGEKFLIKGNIVLNNNRNGIRILSGDLKTRQGGDIADGNIIRNKIDSNKGHGIFLSSDNLPFSVKSVKVSNNIFKNQKNLNIHSGKVVSPSVFQ